MKSIPLTGQAHKWALATWLAIKKCHRHSPRRSYSLRRGAPMRSRFHCLTVVITLLGLFMTTDTLFGDEGMWLFNNPPRAQLKKYNFDPTQKWLDHVRLSSVRFNSGGSGSFVSPHGLVMTNHHIALDDLQKNSTAAHDYVKNGFYAATEDQEMKSPDLEVNVLMSMEEVTHRVMEALKGAKTPEQEFAARKAVIAGIERESEKQTGMRSDVVTLYQGGEYWLYRYKKYT